MFIDIQFPLSQSVHLIVLEREVCSHAHICIIFFILYLLAMHAGNSCLKGAAILCCIAVMSFYEYDSTMCSKLYFLEEKLGGPEGVQIEGSTFLTDLFTRLQCTAYGHKKASF